MDKELASAEVLTRSHPHDNGGRRTQCSGQKSGAAKAWSSTSKPRHPRRRRVTRPMLWTTGATDHATTPLRRNRIHVFGHLKERANENNNADDSDDENDNDNDEDHKDGSDMFHICARVGPEMWDARLSAHPDHVIGDGPRKAKQCGRKKGPHGEGGGGDQDMWGSPMVVLIARSARNLATIL